MKNKIKKLKINKVIRLALIVFLILVLSSVSFLLYKELKIPIVKEEKVKLYSYINKSSIDYKVLLKPNNLYDIPTLDEGQYYITSYVDIIQAAFKYEFVGERPADLKGSYEIAALLEGYKDENNNRTVIWEKQFILSPKEDFASKEERMSLIKTVDIRLDEFSNFAKKIVEETKVRSSLQLSIYMKVNLAADTDKGIVEVTAAPTLVLPLEADYFMITESEVKEEPGSIEETRQVQLPPDKFKVRMYILSLFVLVFAVLGLLIFTEPIIRSQFTKKLNKIFKQHGSRLVALDNELPAVSLEKCFIVRSIDDLVRVADELGKPIMYEFREEYNDMVHFYVLDSKMTYIYTLRETTAEANVPLSGGNKVAF